MAIEIKDILGYQGIELGESADLDTYKKSFDQVYIKRDNALNDDEIKSAIVGETTRKYATELKRAAKESGIDLSEDENKLPVHELARLIPAKKDEFYTAKITELESKMGKPSEALQALQTEYDKLKGKYSDVERMKDDLAGKLTQKDEELGKFQKDFKLNEVRKDVWSRVSSGLSDTASELEKKGFMASINERYTIDLDEDKPVIMLDGKRIPDPNKHGEFLAPVDVLLMEAEKAKIKKVTDTGKYKPQGQTTTQATHTPEGTRKRVIRL